MKRKHYIKLEPSTDNSQIRGPTKVDITREDKTCYRFWSWLKPSNNWALCPMKKKILWWEVYYATFYSARSACLYFVCLGFMISYIIVILEHTLFLHSFLPSLGLLHHKGIHLIHLVRCATGVSSSDIVMALNHIWLSFQWFAVSG